MANHLRARTKGTQSDDHGTTDRERGENDNTDASALKAANERDATRLGVSLAEPPMRLRTGCVPVEETKVDAEWAEVTADGSRVTKGDET